MSALTRAGRNLPHLADWQAVTLTFHLSQTVDFHVLLWLE